MAKHQSYGSRPTMRAMALQHVIVFLICVVFPGLVTLVAPATWLMFDRAGDGVQCRTWTCVYFVVPYKIQQVDQVVEIGHRERAGKTERQRRFGRTTGKTVEVDGEGFLQIRGVDDHQIEVSVSPASLESVVEKANAFLNSPADRTLSLFAIANWKFGGLMGGILTMFTVLYVVGYTLGFLKFVAGGLWRVGRARR